VTVSDQYGCESSASVNVIEPAPMSYEIILKDIGCSGQTNGGITIFNAQGGVTPWLSSLDGLPSTNQLAYQGLTSGMHHLVIMDQNGCQREEQFFIEEPDDWTLDLGMDLTLPYGTTYHITSMINGQPLGQIQYVWSDHLCDGCDSRIIEALSKTTYKLIATDENGCTQSDEITIDVFIDKDLFIPNIFSPNGDQINDWFGINGGSGIEEIAEMTIFDRWGNLMFQLFHFPPNDPGYSWDGRMNDRLLNPGVYIYKIVVLHKDNTREVKFGDVTLVR
jgi:gliding motility-associated-like protein